MAADVNGDAKADLISHERYVSGDPPPPAGTMKVALSTGAGFAPAQTWLAAGLLTSGQIRSMGDADGDGKADFLTRVSNNAWMVCLSTGSSFAAPAQWHAGFGSGSPLDVWVGDVTGDGKTDLVWKGSPSGTWMVAASDGSAFGAGQTWLSNFAAGYDWLNVFGGNVNGN